MYAYMCMYIHTFININANTPGRSMAATRGDPPRMLGGVAETVDGRGGVVCLAVRAGVSVLGDCTRDDNVFGFSAAVAAICTPFLVL